MEKSGWKICYSPGLLLELTLSKAAKASTAEQLKARSMASSGPTKGTHLLKLPRVALNSISNVPGATKKVCNTARKRWM